MQGVEGESAAATRSGFSARGLRVEHIPALSVALFVLIGSYLYFTGLQYQDTKARAFGLAGDPAEASVQRTMRTGASILIDGPKSLLFFIFIIGLSWSFIQGWHYLTRRKSGNASKISKVETFFEYMHIPFGILIYFFSVIAIGRTAGTFDAGGIREDVTHHCSECFRYHSGKHNVVGIAVARTDKLTYVHHKAGLVAMSNDSLEIIDLRHDKAVRPTPSISSPSP